MFDVTITQDGAEVTPEKLGRYQAVVFFTAINPPGVDKDGLIEWVRKGGAFVGIHSTANTYPKNPAFGAMLGASFDRRPFRTKENPQMKVRVIVEDRMHPATRHLGESFEISDDIYQLKNFDRSKVAVAAPPGPRQPRPGESQGEPRGSVFPVAWAKTHGQGRVFYTALGDWERPGEDLALPDHI